MPHPQVSTPDVTQTGAPVVRSLADDLRARSDEDLVALLHARPDLTRPVPMDTTALAARSSTPSSTRRAVEALDGAQLAVLEAAVIVESTSPATVASSAVEVIEPWESAVATVLGLGEPEDRGRAVRRPRPDAGDAPGDADEPEDGDRELVARTLDELWRRGLLWRDEAATHVVRSVVEALGPRPSGLGPAYRELRTGGGPLTPPSAGQLRAALEEASSTAQQILVRLAEHGPVAVRPSGEPGEQAVAWLLEQGLLVPMGSGRVVMPREVGLLVRRHLDPSIPAGIAPELPAGEAGSDDGSTPATGRPAGARHGAARLHEPMPSTHPVRTDLLESAASAAAVETVTQVEELTLAWSSEPPRVLRSGGLGVRELGRLASRLGVDTRRAAFVAELAVAAGLIADDGELEPVWAGTDSLEEWLDADPATRWTTLVHAWWLMPRAPHLIGRQPSDGPASARPAGALGPELTMPGVRLLRHETLRALADATMPASAAPRGGAPEPATPGVTLEVSVQPLVELLLWRRPLRPAPAVAELAAVALEEARWLGLVVTAPRSADIAVGDSVALSAPGRALADGSRQAADSPDAADSLTRLTRLARELLPAAVDHVLVQADLTVIAPGPLEGELAAFMRLVADVESRGGATVLRLTPASVRRAMDAGWGADAVIDTLREASRTPLPQPVDYLVRDVARRHGQVRLGPAGGYLRCDDEALVATLLADRRLAAFRLRRLAPTVLVHQAHPAALLEALRGAGLGPVLESAEGALVSAQPRRVARGPAAQRRETATTAVATAATTTRTSAQDHAPEIVSRLRAGDAAAQLAPRPAATTPLVIIEALREAAAGGRQVQLAHADPRAGVVTSVVTPVSIAGGIVVVRGGDGRERVHSLSRITSVSSLEDHGDGAQAASSPGRP